ncbi:MAG: M28 family metallopeptidase, partial [Tannerellaceae bacterium]
SAKVPLTALYDRNVAFDPTMNFDKLPTPPDIKLDEEQYAKIYKMAKERRSFELEFDIRNHFKMGPVKYHNIVAVIPGAKKPNEYVLLSGHLDAFDVATGGVDDGSGVTPVMEAARLLAASKAKPDRTIVFCLFAGEEFGLLGAKAYTETHKEELGKISNLFNRDGGPTVPVGIDVPENMVQDFEKIAVQIRKLNPDFPFKVGTMTPRPQPKGMGGTDASVFAVEGVPTMHLITADSKGYDFSYGEIWHTERDLYNKSIPEYQEQAAAVMAIMALGVANLDYQITGNDVYTQE